MPRPQFGYAMLSEQTPADELIINAVLAEDAGFDYVTLSDHFHPWTDKQGHSPFTWEVIGALSQITENIKIGTAVTCPTMRYHPAIIAQAAATASIMTEGRFFLGIGTGENLNEHIVGMGWPDTETRLFMLAEAVQVIRALWEGGNKDFKGNFYTVEDARIYDLPQELPKIIMAASGPKSATTAGLVADGIMSTTPDAEVIKEFQKNGGKSDDLYGHLIVSYNEDEEQAAEMACDIWPIAGMPSSLHSELALPQYFEEVSHLITQENISKKIVCGPAPQKHIQAIKKYLDQGFNHIQIAQIGPDQEEFINFYKNSVLPYFKGGDYNG